MKGTKKGEKHRRANGSTACEVALKNLWRCLNLQTSGVILGMASQSCQHGPRFSSEFTL